MERKFKISIGEYYHVYNRGVDKRIVFMDEEDKKRFIRLLYLCNDEKRFEYRNRRDDNLSEIETRKIVSIGAYCLMGNHFHILLKETTERGISKFMEKLMTAYSMYFNKKNKRTGPLFAGAFKAEHCSRDEHLKYLYAYIHLNPLKFADKSWKKKNIINNLSMKKFLGSYTISSYLDYALAKNIKDREEASILTKKDFPDYFTETDFSKFTDFWISFRNDFERT